MLLVVCVVSVWCCVGVLFVRMVNVLMDGDGGDVMNVMIDE